MTTVPPPCWSRVAAVLLGASTTVLLAATPAVADGPLAAGWWNLANQGVAPPPPPDVGPEDLLVQGGPRPSAVAALRFVVADGATVGPLTLPLAGPAPGRADTVLACPTTVAFEPAAGGAWSKAPTWSCERSSAAVLSADGTALLLPDIARLVTEAGTLSFVLVPGPSDRVVLAKPSQTALTVTAPRTAPAPPAPAPAPAAPAPAPVAGAPARPFLAGPATLMPAFVPAPVPAPVAVPVQAPVVSVVPVPVNPSAALATAARTTPSAADDGRTRLLLAAEALLLLAFFGLLGAGPLSALARLTGQPVVSGERPRGIGRFAGVREGPAPRL